MTQENSYSIKLRDPRWQKLRLFVLERDNWTCQKCLAKNKTLTVHHLYYIPNRDPWDYPEDILITLCETCNQYEYEYIEMTCECFINCIRKYCLSDEIDELIINIGRYGKTCINNMIIERYHHGKTN